MWDSVGRLVHSHDPLWRVRNSADCTRPTPPIGILSNLKKFMILAPPRPRMRRPRTTIAIYPAVFLHGTVAKHQCHPPTLCPSRGLVPLQRYEKDAHRNNMSLATRQSTSRSRARKRGEHPPPWHSMPPPLSAFASRGMRSIPLFGIIVSCERSRRTLLDDRDGTRPKRWCDMPVTSRARGGRRGLAGPGPVRPPARAPEIDPGWGRVCEQRATSI
ncbi:hypothetical protein LZ30DRAFT_722359 [Colletotrichum cereale]|nr:hypothetical protein LZ30DRAFT_722359 [Colletotrichum cereale]